MVVDDYWFKFLIEIWLGGDYYKWCVMCFNGVDECFCIGKEMLDWEKFEKWVEMVLYIFCNLLYYWMYLELKIVFGIDKVLNLKIVCEIYDECNEKFFF